MSRHGPGRLAAWLALSLGLLAAGPDLYAAAARGEIQAWTELLAEARATGDPLPLPSLVEHAPPLPRRARDQLAWIEGLRSLFADQPGDAAASFRSVRERAPEYPAAQLELARIQRDRGELREAGEHYIQAVGPWDRGELALLELSELYQSLGRHEESLHYAGLVPAEGPIGAQAAMVRARSLAELGAVHEALGALKVVDVPSVEGLSWLPQAELLRAELAVELCQPDEARRALGRFEALGDPGDPRAFRALWWRDTELWLRTAHAARLPSLSSAAELQQRTAELMPELVRQHDQWRAEAQLVAERAGDTPSAGEVVYVDRDDWPFRGEFWEDEVPGLVYAGAGCSRPGEP